MAHKLTQHIIKNNLGKSMIYYQQTPQQLTQHCKLSFTEEVSYKKRETLYVIKRKLDQLNPCKTRRKYWTDVKRHYDQKQVGFFVSQVLAKRKVSIPLR